MMLKRENDDKTSSKNNVNNNGISSSSATDLSFCEQKCDLILERCRGFDSTEVEDDGGGTQQTVSVENSFRRGTVTTEEAVRDALAELCERLPPLIRDRVAWSRDPSLAYPITIRLTVRSMRKKVPQQQQQGPNRRNPYFITRSKQASIGSQRGRALLASSGNIASKSEEETRAVRILQESVNPLLQQLVFQSESHYSDGNKSFSRSSSINITRMNLAVANFQDVIVKGSPHQSPYTHPSRSKINYASGQGQPSPTDTIEYNNLIQRQWECNSNLGVQGNSHLEGLQNKKRNNDQFAATPSSASSVKRRQSPNSGSSKSPRKFSRTRIDQFFTKKQR